MTRALCSSQYAALLSSSSAAGRSRAHVAGAVHCRILRTLPHPPPTHLLNHLLTAYGKAGRHARARRLFDAVPHPNLFTYNALLSTLAHARLLDGTEALFASMPERDVVSYNALMAGFSGEPARAARAYRALLREDTGAIRPSRITMSAMVRAASALGDRALGPKSEYRHQLLCSHMVAAMMSAGFQEAPLVV